MCCASDGMGRIFLVPYHVASGSMRLLWRLPTICQICPNCNSTLPLFTLLTSGVRRGILLPPDIKCPHCGKVHRASLRLGDGPFRLTLVGAALAFLVFVEVTGAMKDYWASDPAWEIMWKYFLLILSTRGYAVNLTWRDINQKRNLLAIEAVVIRLLVILLVAAWTLVSHWAWLVVFAGSYATWYGLSERPTQQGRSSESPDTGSC